MQKQTPLRWELFPYRPVDLKVHLGRASEPFHFIPVDRLGREIHVHLDPLGRSVTVVFRASRDRLIRLFRRGQRRARREIARG